MKHIHNGGTAITNFGIEQKPIYEEAIRQYGKGDLFIAEPMRSHYGYDLSGSCLALHSTTPGKFPKDISSFWRIFEPIRSAAK